MQNNKISILFITILTILLSVSCSEEEEFAYDNSTHLMFSTDTVTFDTIFTSIGSATKRFKIYNKNKKGVRIESVRLGSGGNSGFRVNLDGVSNTQFSDVEIYHGDSIFCFVEVTIDPHDSDLPLLKSDSLIFTLPNGVVQKVFLQAYGQDIIELRDKHITTDMTLDSKRPYVIYNNLTVEECATLTIQPGTTLYFHADAGLEVHGSLVAEGTIQQPIIMRGDRTDKLLPYLPYDRTAGTWQGIKLHPESNGNKLTNCNIHGGKFGIMMLSNDKSPKSENRLYILNSIIHNVSGNALYIIDGQATIHNSQISNAKGYCAAIIGGNVEFTHCTLAQFYIWDEYLGALYFANHEGDEEYPLNQLTFNNSIITGYRNDEIFGSQLHDSDINFNYRFNNCLINTILTEDDEPNFLECVVDTINDSKRGKESYKDLAKSREGNFRSVDTNNFTYSFQLDTLSVARKMGDGKFTPSDCKTDLNGIERPSNKPDVGCYQLNTND